MSEASDSEFSQGGTLASLLERKRLVLKSTQTKVTNFDGTVDVVDHGATVRLPRSEFGFVVDTKPDLSVGEVMPWLLLSSQDVASDAELLQKLQITHVLSLLPGFTLAQNSESFKIKHFCLELYDEESCPLEFTILQPALAFILEAKVSGRILIHCNAGISRAPSVVMYYLMAMEGMSFDSAWNSVKSARPSAKPNKGFWNQLKTQKFKKSEQLCSASIATYS